MFRTMTTTLSALFAAVTLLSASAVHADPLYFAGPNPTANRPSVTPPGQVAINTAPGAPIYVGPGGSGPAVAPVAAPQVSRPGVVNLDVQSGGTSSGGSIVNSTSSGDKHDFVGNAAVDVAEVVMELTDGRPIHHLRPSETAVVRPYRVPHPQAEVTTTVITAPVRHKPAPRPR